MFIKILFVNSIILSVFAVVFSQISLTKINKLAYHTYFREIVMELPFYLEMLKNTNESTSKARVNCLQVLAAVQIDGLLFLQEKGVLEEFCEELKELGLLDEFKTQIKSAMEIHTDEQRQHTVQLLIGRDGKGVVKDGEIVERPYDPSDDIKKNERKFLSLTNLLNKIEIN